MKQTITRKVEPKLFISFSSYKTFKNCPELYNQNYLISREDKQDNFKAFDNYEASIGTAVQAVFEHLINKNIQITNLDSIFKRLDDDIIYLSELLVPLDTYKFENSKFYIEDNHIITKFQAFAVDTSKYSIRQIRRKFITETATMYRKPLTKFLELYQPSKMSSEVKLQVEFKNFILGGKLDFVHYIDKNNIEVIDGKRQYNPLWTDPEQLYIYGIMVKKQLNRTPKKMNYWDWKSNKIHNLPMTQSDMDNTFKNLEDFYDKLQKSIKTNRFRRKVGFHCKWCPVKDSCDKHSTEPTAKGEFETF